MYTYAHALMHTHTHTHTHCGENWILILVGWKYCEKRKVFSLILKDDSIEGLVVVNSKNVGSKVGESAKAVRGMVAPDVCC